MTIFQKASLFDWQSIYYVNNYLEVLIEYLDSETLIINWLSFEPYKHKYIKISSEGE